MVGRDAHPVIYLAFNDIDRIGATHIECDSFAIQSLHKDLHFILLYNDDFLMFKVNLHFYCNLSWVCSM